MIPRYRLSQQAAADLGDIWSYIAQVSPSAADRVLDELYEAFVNLGSMPLMGHLREDLVDEPLRIWSVRHYMIIYRPETDPIEIVRVVSRYRDVAGLFP